MIKRTVEISREPAHLAVRDGQLLVLRKDEEPERLPAHPANLAGSIPCEDIGLVSVDSRDTTYSHAALAELLDHGAAVLVCGRNHQPAGLLLPLGSHSTFRWRVDDQLGAARPVKKQLWRQIVTAKIRAQAALLRADSPERTDLEALAARVGSGDPDNVEAQAARRYWSCWLPGQRWADFRRTPGEGAPPNNLLDYGYAVLRAAVARAIVSAGLLPVLGIHHDHRANAFALADDLVEPLRPMADRAARGLVAAGITQLVPPAKAQLLTTLTQTVRLEREGRPDAEAGIGPLMVMLHRYTASFVRCLRREEASLAIPAPLPPEPEPCRG